MLVVRTETLTNSLEASQRSKHTKSSNEKNSSSSIPPMVTKPSFKHTIMMSPILRLSSQHITFNNNNKIKSTFNTKAADYSSD